MNSSAYSKRPHGNTIIGTPSSATQSTQTSKCQLQTSKSNNNLLESATQTTYNILQTASIYNFSKINYEFDVNNKNLRKNLNDVLECLEQRSATQISIIYELQDFFKKRAEIEAQYSKDLDKLVENIYEKHKSEKSKRKMWNLFSSVKLWESVLNDTKQHSKYHKALSDVCSKYIGEKCDEIIEDVKRIFTKCKSVSKVSHEEIFKAIGELHGAMKTYHEHQSESKQAEEKLKDVISKKPKTEKQGSEKKMKEYEKEVEKSQQNSMDKKIEAFKARNKFILSIDLVNAGINKYYKEDIDDLIDVNIENERGSKLIGGLSSQCIDFRFIHGSIAKCINMYISGQEDIKRSRQITMYVLNRAIDDLDSNSDKKAFLDSNANVFSIKNIFQCEQYKGDEVSQLNAQVLTRHDMENIFEELESRLKTLKTENNEIYKTIEATEQSLLDQYDLKTFDLLDVSDLYSANTNQNGLKERRLEIEDFYITKFEQYTIKSNLIARLEAQHAMMKKTLSSPTDRSLDAQQFKLSQEKPKKKIGKLPPIEQPFRLFGGDLIQYLNATKQEIPLIVTSCIKAIKRLGLHNEGIFRVTGSKEKIEQFKAAFESGEDPLIRVNNPKEIYSVADVLKSYFRELRNPLFPDDKVEALANIMIATSECEPVEQQEKQKIESLKEFIEKLPYQIYVGMRYLFAFLNHLYEFKEKNLMNSNAIAVCIAPSLIPAKGYTKDISIYKYEIIRLIEFIIVNHDAVFCNESIQGPLYEKFETQNISDEIKKSPLLEYKEKNSRRLTIFQIDNGGTQSRIRAVSPNGSASTATTACSSNKFDVDLNFKHNNNQPTLITTKTVTVKSNSKSTSPQCSINNKSSAQKMFEKPSTISEIIKKFNNNGNETPKTSPKRSAQQASTIKPSENTGGGSSQGPRREPAINKQK